MLLDDLQGGGVRLNLLQKVPQEANREDGGTGFDGPNP